MIFGQIFVEFALNFKQKECNLKIFILTMNLLMELKILSGEFNIEPYDIKSDSEENENT